MTSSGQRLTVLKNVNPTTRSSTGKPIMKVSPIVTTQGVGLSTATSTISQPLAAAIVQQWKSQSNGAATTGDVTSVEDGTKIESEFVQVDREQLRKERRTYKLNTINNINCRRCDATPLYGADLRECTTNVMTACNRNERSNWQNSSHINCLATMERRDTNWSLSALIKSYEERTTELKTVFDNFMVFVPPVSAPPIRLHVSHPHPSKQNEKLIVESVVQQEISPKMTLLHPIISSMSTQVNLFYFIPSIGAPKISFFKLLGV